METPPPTGASFRVPALCSAKISVHGPDQADGEVVRWEANDGFVLHGYRARGYGWVSIPGLASYRFGAVGDAVAVSDGDARDADVEDAWYRSVLPLVLQARGTQVLHASAVVGRHGVVALCGTSTAGKSTLAWALGERGHTAIADDALPFAVVDSRTVVRGLAHRIRLRADVRARHGISQDASLRDPGEELRPLAEVVVLVPDESDSGERLSPVESFTALLPHAYCFALDDLETKAALTDAYLALAQGTPVTRVAVHDGLDRLDETVDVLERILDSD